jgi:RsiW-degrading membrane proteinase PrsW (M82 family)
MAKILDRKIKLPLWIRVFFITLALYALGVFILVITQNTVFFSTVVMLGSFMIPVSYVAFFYQRKFVARVNLVTIIISFVYGGLLGVFIASIFEPLFVQRLDPLTALVVGLIEEFAKIFGLYWIMRGRKHNLQMNGIIIGAAVGMGFAAFESTGYAFDAFLGSGGSLTDTVFVTLLRGILSPLGHGTWTAILAGVLFRESTATKFRITWPVVWAYLGMSTLHGLWDGLPAFLVNFVIPGTDIILAEGVVALIGLLILIISWHSAREREAEFLVPR